MQEASLVPPCLLEVWRAWPKKGELVKLYWSVLLFILIIIYLFLNTTMFKLFKYEKMTLTCSFLYFKIIISDGLMPEVIEVISSTPTYTKYISVH